MKYFRRLFRQKLICFFTLALAISFLEGAEAFAMQDGKFVVKGSVKTTDGEPVVGATIVENGVANGTTSDIDGLFRLEVASGKAELKVSFIGYVSQTVALNNRSSVSLVLIEDVTALEEMVVIGYGNLKKSDLTGSISVVKFDELTKLKSGSFMEAMQGKVSGVMVSSSSGEPGAGVNISIRGAGSINAGTQPLYIIDGMQIDINQGEIARATWGSSSFYNPLASINTNDIESIEILKDASATAIYGSRGANGVVLITTKSGKENTSSVSFDANWGISKVLKKIDMADANEFINYSYEAQPQTWGVDTDADGVIDSPRDISRLPQYNWQDEIYQEALTQQYNLTYDAGSKNTKVSSSLGYLNQEGIVLKNKLERYNARLKASHEASKKVTLESNITISHQKSSGITSNGGGSQFWGILQTIVLFRPVTPDDFEDLAVNDPVNAGMSDPMNFVNDARRANAYTRIMADASINIKLAKGLTLRSQINGGMTFSEDKGWYPVSTAWGYLTNGRLLKNTSQSFSWQNSNVLTYVRTFNRKHALNLMLGAEWSSYQLKTFNMQVENFAISGNMFDMMQMGSTLPLRPEEFFTESTRASFFGRVNYTYDNKYLMSATLRRDGSSRFGEKNKYACFPSVAVAWRISSEEFMKNLEFINNAKLRLSYGVTGNDRIPPYQSLSRTENANTSDATGSATGLALSTLANPHLKWETTYQYNAGIDLGFINNRISLTADVYYKHTSDMLLNADVAGQTGSYKQWQNIGSVENRGLELGITTVNIDKRNFSWSTTLNFNMNRNKILSLGDVSFIPVSINGTNIRNVGRLIVGEPIGTAWGYVFDGIYQKEDFDDEGALKPGVSSIRGKTVSPGWMKFRDIGGRDNTVDDTFDKTVISHSDPKHFGGITNNIRFGDFDFSLFFQWSYGNDILNVARAKFEGIMAHTNITKDYYYNRWTPDKPSNTHPSVLDQGRNECSTYYVEDGSYLRWKNLTIGYSIPLRYTKKLKISYARIYMGVDNLLTFTNYSGSDPEVAYNNNLITGLDNQSYPRAMTFNFGINLKF